MSKLDLPACVHRVHSFDELVATPFAGSVNALCWERSLPAGFAEIVAGLDPAEGVLPLDEARLAALPLSREAKKAVDFMLEDLRRLRTHGVSPELNFIQAYPRDEEPTVMPVDVYSFHADRAPIPADTWLCSYHGAASEGLPNEEAQRRVDVPATRAELLALAGGNDDADFRDFLRENSFDLHYVPLSHARPFSFGLGNLWRIAVDWPGSPVLPCVHRAPSHHSGDARRLLLIS